MKRWATTIVLLGIALSLAVYVLIIDRGSVSTEESELRKNMILPAWRMDDVTRMEIELATPEGLTDKYTLFREGVESSARSWNLDFEGTTYPAEEQTVFAIMSVFEYAKALRTVPPGSVNRATFGLEKPRARYVITMGKLSFDLRVGDMAPSREGHYLEVQGKGVYVVSKGQVRSLEVPADELRSKTFVPYQSTQLTAVSLDGEGGKRRFERASWTGGRGSGFRFGEGAEGPTGRRVDSARFDQVLVAFGRMQAEVFVPKEKADAASKPRVTITLTPKEGPPGVIDVGGACPTKPELLLVVRREPTYLAACVPQSVLPPLLHPASEFVDDGLLGSWVDEIVELRIERDAKILEIARFGTGFKVRHPTDAEIDLEVGNHLLKDLVDARGEEAPADATLPTNVPITHVRVVSQGGAKTKEGNIPERIEELDIGPELDGKHLVIRKEDGAKLYIGAAAATSLRPSDLLLRSAVVSDMKPMDLEELTVERPDRDHGTQQQTITQSGPDITLVEPKGTGLVADRTSTSRAISAFVQIEALRWVSEKVEPAFGLDSPRFVVRGKYSEESTKERTVVLKLGAPTDDGVYASLSNQEGVFLVKRDYEEAFATSFVSRDSFSIVPSMSDRIEFETRSGVKADLVRDGRQLRWKGKSDARAGELEKELTALDAIAVVSVGAPAKEEGFEEAGLKMTVTPRKSVGDGEPSPVFHVVFGGTGVVDGVTVRFVRRDDVEATFGVPLAGVRRIERLVGE